MRDAAALEMEKAAEPEPETKQKYAVDLTDEDLAGMVEDGDERDTKIGKTGR